MKILIKVTKKILEMSQKCGVGPKPLSPGENCAFALAVREIFPNAVVGRAKMFPLGFEYIKSELIPGTFNLAPIGEAIELPMEATNFIINFDALSVRFKERLLMDEISVEVDVPASVIHKIGISEVYKILSESKTLELVTIQ